jgi:crotonobetainyl-CoA:carnitine CoA-transferase CaiB-like acyl-CoA transferase
MLSAAENPATQEAAAPTGPLAGLRVLDLTRVLAGPTCTQLLGDLGADVVKIERPGAGDDTRSWGPPYLSDDEGRETSESAYYLAVNRNKRSVALDIDTQEGRSLAYRLAGEADILIENFKVGGLAKYGLSYADLHQSFPRLIYCSITGFGQTGPYAARAGYDYLVQGMAGIMSITGEPAGEPVKVGVAIADVMTGMHATVAILAALHHRDRTGEGQHIDLALLDSTISWLCNQGQSYLLTGALPERYGNAHPTIVPYQVFATSDGHVILAVGNDNQFAKFCAIAGLPHLAADPLYRCNPDRVRNRATLVPALENVLRTRPSADWVASLEQAGVPCGLVNKLDSVFADPQVAARGMVIEMQHALRSQALPLIGNPEKFSATPVSFRRPPPLLGEHTEEVLQEWLGTRDSEA